MSALASPVAQRQSEIAPIPAFRGGTTPTIQRASMRVSSPTDSAEREASTVARAVVNMRAAETAAQPMSGVGGGVLRRLGTPAVARLTRPSGLIQRSAAPAASGGDVSARIQSSLSGGSPLPGSVRRFMEPRFAASFDNVRVHTDANAATLSRQLSAQAFTTGNHVFFARDQFQPETTGGRELIAHELAHTIQQGAVAREPVAGVQRQEDLTLTPQPSGMIQRLGLSDILDGLAELAANVPGFTLLTLIIGRNPINMRVVDRNAVNVLRAFMGLIPGGEILFQVLQRYGVIERLGNWVSAQTASLGLNFQTVRDAFTRFTDSLGWSDIFSPGDVWRRARNIFTPIIERITAFVGGLVSQAITWLKETFMEPLSGFCRQIPGYGLVTVMLGRDPFTNAPVARTALTVVRAFAEFIPGGAEKVDQLVQSGALERAYAWFQQETGARNLTWDRVTGTFSAAWASLQLSDVLHPIDTLQRIVGLFRPLFVDLVSFAGAALLKLLELIYEAAMGAGGRRILDILMRARSTFIIIIRNPVGFLGNLLGAVGQGVRQFMSRIMEHLRDGVIAWLTGPVARAGIQMPERWDLRGIIWFVLQILGLTWARVREKLVRLIGEPAMAMLERGLQFIQDVRDRGLVATLRERVTEFFGTLRDSALGAIRNFIQQRLVMAGITQLLSMLNPVGAIIQAIIKTYTTIQFFIQRINQILDLVESVVNSIAAIASGAISAAADFVERTMARTIPVILDFLARFIGLGDVGAQVQTTIRNLQGAVDRMLDRAVEWIRNQARNLASRALGGDPNAPSAQRVESGLTEAVAVVNQFAGRPVAAMVLRPLLAAIRLRHRLRVLDVVPLGDIWLVDAAASPGVTRATTARVAPTTIRTRVSYVPGGATSKSTSVYAFPLTHLAGSTAMEQGSPANRESNAFPRAWIHTVNEAAPTKPWRRMHLLSAELHGPGNVEANIVPAVERINSRMRSGPETWGKTQIIAKSTNVGWYKVTVGYGHPSPYNEFPSSVSVQGGFCIGDPANPMPGPAVDASSLSENGLDLPNTPGAVVAGPPSIRRSTWRELFGAFRADGMTQLVAQWLAGSTFPKDDVVAAMSAFPDAGISGKARVVADLLQTPNPRLLP